MGNVFRKKLNLSVAWENFIRCCRYSRRTSDLFEPLRIPNNVILYVRRNPLVWALPLQALLLLSNLDLLDPWGDEWVTLSTVPQPVTQVVSAVAENIQI